jgi:hypothetical protein
MPLAHTTFPSTTTATTRGRSTTDASDRVCSSWFMRVHGVIGIAGAARDTEKVGAVGSTDWTKPMIALWGGKN